MSKNNTCKTLNKYETLNAYETLNTTMSIIHNTNW